MAIRNGQGTHFWIMTFLVRNSLGLAAEERVGHWTPPLGMTRFDAMGEIRRQVIEVSPFLADAVVISFDLQPNEI